MVPGLVALIVVFALTSGVAFAGRARARTDTKTSRAQAAALQTQLSQSQQQLAAQQTSEAAISQVKTLARQLRQLSRLTRALGQASSGRQLVLDCLKAILAASNSITYQSQWYSAYQNVTTGPQCSSVIVTTHR